MCSMCGGCRSAPLAERRALAHAEAVLLVDHGHRQRAEAHVRLDQRVRADDQRQLAARQLAEDVARAARAGVEPVSSAHRHRLGAEQPLDRREVLLGERLGRRHQRRLAAVLDGAQHRVQRHHRLAAADLAHQQPLHRRGVARGPRRSSAIARAGRRSSANGSPCSSQRALSVGRLVERDARRVCARRCARRRRNTQLRRAAAPRRPAAGGPPRASPRVAREVHRGERARAVGQPPRRARAPRGSGSVTSASAPARPARASGSASR